MTSIFLIRSHLLLMLASVLFQILSLSFSLSRCLFRSRKYIHSHIFSPFAIVFVFVCLFVFCFVFCLLRWNHMFTMAIYYIYIYICEKQKQNAWAHSFDLHFVLIIGYTADVLDAQKIIFERYFVHINHMVPSDGDCICILKMPGD